MLFFVGESGCGKSTIVAELTKRNPEKFKNVVSYTSRPSKPKEIDGVDYYFFPKNYFINNENLVLLKKNSDGYYYGTRKSDLYSNTHHLLLQYKLTSVDDLITLNYETPQTFDFLPIRNLYSYL